jgi:hypothetical protein
MVRSVHHDPALSQQCVTSSHHGYQLNYEAGVTELLFKVLLQGFQQTRDCSGSTGFISFFPLLWPNCIQENIIVI